MIKKCSWSLEISGQGFDQPGPENGDFWRSKPTAAPFNVSDGSPAKPRSWTPGALLLITLDKCGKGG